MLAFHHHMSEIKQINLEFNCPENWSTLEPTGPGYSCSKCNKGVIDFTLKTNEELQRTISESSQPICGIFKRSQLSQKFLKYAAATFIASATSFGANGQSLSQSDSVALQKAIDSLMLTEFDNESELLLGTITEVQAEPIGGLSKILPGSFRSH